MDGCEAVVTNEVCQGQCGVWAPSDLGLQIGDPFSIPGQCGVWARSVTGDHVITSWSAQVTIVRVSLA